MMYADLPDTVDDAIEMLLWLRSAWISASAST